MALDARASDDRRILAEIDNWRFGELTNGRCRVTENAIRAGSHQKFIVNPEVGLHRIPGDINLICTRSSM